MRIVSPDPGTDEPGEGTTWPPTALLAKVVVGLLAAAILVLLVARAGAERDAIRRLSPAQRQAAVARAVAELREVCGQDRPAGMRDHCRETAAFVSRFAECRGECADLARRELVVPTR